MPASKAHDISLQQMRRAAFDATALLKCLANEERLLLLCQLSQGEFCVSELEARLDIYQPTLSQQLAVLRAQQLVSTRRAGKQIFYRLSEPRAMALLQTLYDQFCGPKAGGRNAD